MSDQDSSAASSGGAVSLERLAEVLATVQRQCPELAVLAIRWMHLRHPLHPLQDALLRGAPAPGGSGPLRGIRRLTESVIYAGYCWGRLLALRLRTRQELAAVTRQSFDLIAKSWVRSMEGADCDGDFYYGDLQQRLARQGIRVLLLCGNLGGEGWTRFAKACARAPLPRLSELCLLPLAAPLRMLARQWRACRRLRRLAATAEDALVKRISRLASLECLAPETARAGFYYWIGQTAVRAWRPRAFLTVYEAQGWEQALRWGLKTADPACCVLGYQHTFVFPEARSLVAPPRTTGLPLHPDVVLCLGQRPREQLRAGHEPYGARLVPFGSLWYRPARAEAPAAPSRRTVLVVPEGHPSAVQPLFQFACACARRLPSYTFLLRGHPVFPRTPALRAVLEGLPQQPNAVFSERHVLEDDIGRSSIVLYRGSWAVVSAILHGLLPVYVMLPGGDGHDPLAGLTAWHARCETPEELAGVLARHERAPRDRLEADWRAAAQDLHDWTGPVTEASLEALLEAAGLRSQARAITEAIHA